MQGGNRIHSQLPMQQEREWAERAFEATLERKNGDPWQAKVYQEGVEIVKAHTVILGALGGLLAVIWKSRCHCKANL